MTNLINIYIGAWDGRLFQFILETLESKPRMIQMTPATGNAKTACLGVAINERYLAIGSAWGTLNLWEKKDNTWQPIEKITLHGGEKDFSSEIKGVAMDDQYLYAGSITGKIEIFDMNNKFKRVGEIKNLGKHILGLEVNDKAIFAISKDGKFTALDKKTRKSIFERKFKSVGNFKTLQALTISDKYVCFASSGKVHGYIWDDDTMKLTEIGEFTNTHNTCMDLHLYKNMCYSGAWDGQLRSWDLESNDSEPKDLIEGYGSLESVCADDNFIYAGGHSGSVYVIDIKSLDLAFNIPINKINPKPGAPNQINVLFLG
ncbi:MAG: WD40 repeat domain-containing protein [Candidatus Lokiarchaeota archaeon]|nr:WD40 repeat domain-containing protein [Candidatus Lokiarchaeota archaeon]